MKKKMQKKDLRNIWYNLVPGIISLSTGFFILVRFIILHAVDMSILYIILNATLGVLWFWAGALYMGCFMMEDDLEGNWFLDHYLSLIIWGVLSYVIIFVLRGVLC